MEFLVKNRVFEDFKIEFLPKIEFFDFWPNRVFVKSHKKKACIRGDVVYTTRGVAGIKILGGHRVVMMTS